jgi:hypothetical protein
MSDNQFAGLLLFSAACVLNGWLCYRWGWSKGVQDGVKEGLRVGTYETGYEDGLKDGLTAAEAKDIVNLLRENVYKKVRERIEAERKRDEQTPR